MDLLTNLKQSLDELSNVERSAPHYNDKSQLVLNVLDISSVVFLHSIFTEEERKTQWNSLLSLLCSFTDLSFIHYILQKVNFLIVLAGQRRSNNFFNVQLLKCCYLGLPTQRKARLELACFELVGLGCR